jgi:hypothetical protein
MTALPGFLLPGDFDKPWMKFLAIGLQAWREMNWNIKKLGRVLDCGVRPFSIFFWEVMKQYHNLFFYCRIV